MGSTPSLLTGGNIRQIQESSYSRLGEKELIATEKVRHGDTVNEFKLDGESYVLRGGNFRINILPKSQPSPRCKVYQGRQAQVEDKQQDGTENPVPSDKQNSSEWNIGKAILNIFNSAAPLPNTPTNVSERCANEPVSRAEDGTSFYYSSILENVKNEETQETLVAAYREATYSMCSSESSGFDNDGSNSLSSDQNGEDENKKGVKRHTKTRWSHKEYQSHSKLKIFPICGGELATSPEYEETNKRIDTEAQAAKEIFPLGFSFSPSGLSLSYHLGVGSYLEEVGILRDSVPIAGASSGALVSASFGSGVEAMDCLRSIEDVCEQAKKKGALGRLQDFLKSSLNRLIAEDAHIRLNERHAKVTVGVTEVFPLRGLFVSHFESKSDLMHCLIASCNIPFYSGTWPLVKFRGKQCVDGYLAMPRKEFGCPPSGSGRNVKVSPFSAEMVNMSFTIGNSISPDLSSNDTSILSYFKLGALHANEGAGKDNSALEVEKDGEKRMGDSPHKNKTGSFASSKLPDQDSPPRSVLRLLKIHPPKSISYYFVDEPNLVQNRFSLKNLVKLSLEGCETSAVQELFDVGRTDAFRWLVLEYIRLDNILRDKWNHIQPVLREFFEENEMNLKPKQLHRNTDVNISEDYVTATYSDSMSHSYDGSTIKPSVTTEARERKNSSNPEKERHAVRLIKFCYKLDTATLAPVVKELIRLQFITPEFFHLFSDQHRQVVNSINCIYD